MVLQYHDKEQRRTTEEKEMLNLTWQGRYHDHERGFPRARLTVGTPDVLTAAISPDVGTATA